LLKKYFTKALLYNILIAFGIIGILLFIVQRGLNSYTRHGESITVPDLRGMSFAQVKTILGGKNLDWQIMDSVYDMNKPPFSIVDQNPKPNSKVKEGRTIYITVNAVTAPTTEVPDLIGRSSLKYAKMQLESYGLKVGEPIYQPDPHLNAVIGMQIKGRNVTRKMKVPRGTEVVLILGNGLGNSRISVPYLIGLRYEDVDFKLKGYSLNIGSVVVAEGVTDTMGAIVYKQSPEYGPGKSIRMGEAIDLFLAKELPAGITVDPTLYDKVDTIPSQ
jgi:eukaryotic-like serine/threonine-protein kinase